MKMSGLKIELETRGCTVNGELGLFHCWEQYSKPLPASPLVGGEPAGIFSHVFGIVEFPDGVRRIDPTDICFCDERNEFLTDMTKHMKMEKMTAELNRHIKDIKGGKNEENDN